MKLLSVGTHLKVEDAATSHKFYASLGFKPVFAYGSSNFLEQFSSINTAIDSYNGVVYDVCGAPFEIADGHIGIKNQDVFGHTIKTEKVSAMVKVDTLTPLFSNSLLNITYPVRKYHWGTIEVALRDPDGFVLVFIAEATDLELKRVNKFIEVEEYNNER
ncbi:MAG: hypothetical protein AAF413_04750 [Patescibacteria group bacterium]